VPPVALSVVVKAFPRVACGSEVVLTASAVAAFAVCDGEAESRQEKMSARVMLATRVLNIFRKICSVQKGKLVSQIALPEPKLNRNPDTRTNILFGNGYYSYPVTETGAHFVIREAELRICMYSLLYMQEFRKWNKKPEFVEPRINY
jgi:hypothetical protein